VGRRFIVAAGFAIVVAIAGVLIWRMTASEPTARAEANPDAGAVAAASPDDRTAKPQPVDRTARIAGIQGAVERSIDGKTWVAAKVGDELGLAEHVRTGPDGSVTLDIAGRATVELAASSHFSVREISETLARVMLDRGRASASVDTSTKSTLRMEFAGTKTAAESKGGKFAAIASGKGQVTVATNRGKVKLRGDHADVDIPENMQSTIFGDAPPTEPVVPPSLYLKIQRPRRKLQRSRKTIVRGTVTPGAVISVNGVRYATDSTGSFKATVALREGKNVLVVEAETVTGGKRESKIPIVVKSRVKKLEGTTTWGAPKKHK